MTLAGIVPGAVSPTQVARIPGDLYRSNLTAFLGDSITLGNGGANFFGGQAYPTIACENSGGVIRPYINAGVSGNTTTQMLARVQSDIINAQAVKPGKCIVLGGTNDVGTIALATSLANLASIYDQLRAAGIEPIGATIPPKTTQQTAIASLNIGIKSLCDKRGMICLDFHSVLVDPSNGQYLAGYSGDGTHPNDVGRRAISTLIQAKLTPLYRPIGPNLCQDNTEAANLISDGMFLGTPSGGVAGSWTGNSVSGTTTPTIVSGDTNILGNWQVLTCTVAGQYYISQTIASGTASPQGWAVGDVLEFAGIVDVNAESGTGGGPTVRVHLTGGSGGDMTPVYQQSTDVTRGVFFRRFTVQTGNTGMAIQAYANHAGTGTCTVKFAQFSLYNLTRLGLA